MPKLPLPPSPPIRATCTSFSAVKNKCLYFLIQAGSPPPIILAMPERKHFFFRRASLMSHYVPCAMTFMTSMFLMTLMTFMSFMTHGNVIFLLVGSFEHLRIWKRSQCWCCFVCYRPGWTLELLAKLRASAAAGVSIPSFEGRNLPLKNSLF